MPGPAKTAIHLRVLRGTATGRLPVAPAASGLLPLNATPSPPAWMSDPEARREWRRLAPILVTTRLLNDGNIGLLAQACAAHGRLCAIWSSGATANTALIMSYRTMLNSLGLLAWNPPPAPKRLNPFAKFRCESP